MPARRIRNRRSTVKHDTHITQNKKYNLCSNVQRHKLTTDKANDSQIVLFTSPYIIQASQSDDSMIGQGKTVSL